MVDRECTGPTVERTEELGHGNLQRRSRRKIDKSRTIVRGSR